MTFWNCNGKFIGNAANDYLYSKEGKPIGFFIGKELYDFDGKYLAEIVYENRLAVNIFNKERFISPTLKPNNVFSPFGYSDANVCLLGLNYEDFSLGK